MQDNKVNESKDSGQVPETKSRTESSANLSPEELNEKIKNEPDTERLRSERQSVIDGEKGRDTD